PAALDEIEGVLTGQAVIVRALLPVKPTVTTPELLLAGEPLTVDVDLPANHAIKITVTSETGREVDRRVPRISHGHAHATITDLPPGAYTIDVTGTAPGSPIAPVSSDVIIWDPQP
ncbi:MAG TPA: hypothetical protein VFP72_13250, partial [Kineosporiaceae bacterium]|nr:hypothetical protein [Kineosporiaceae bacterium]